MAVPKEVDRWWSDRSKMKLVGEGGGWQIEGPGRGRARVACACLVDDRLIYELAEEQGNRRR
jgi:hypothetical protein